MNKHVTFDAQAALGFVRSQTTHVETAVNETVYPDIQYPGLVPVDTSAHPFAQTVTYYSSDKFGRADWINGNADDIPLAGTELAEFKTSVYTAAIGYGWGWEEVNVAMTIGRNLQADDALARQAGIACERGVLVDEYCRTSAPDVLAAGDVAVARPAGGGGPIRLESWQNAQDQGAAAALSALDAGQPYLPSGAVWSEQYEAMVQIAGFPARAGREVLRPQADARALLSVALDEDGRVIGAVAVNAARELRQLRQWIAQGTRVDPVQLARADAPLSSARIG